MSHRNLVFDASALIFAKPILPYVKKEYEIKISQLVGEESGILAGVSIVPMSDVDKDFVYSLLRSNSGKESAVSYRRGRRVRNAGEAEALAIAKRLNTPIVLHDKLACTWAKSYRISLIELVDLPEQLRLVPQEDLIIFYGNLCKQRSSQKACTKYSELSSKQSPIHKKQRSNDSHLRV